MSTSTPIDAVIVLGAPPLGPGVPGPAIERRLEHGVAVFRNRGASCLVLSGGIVRTPPAEAEIMRDLAVSRGVPEARIVVEDQAKNTFENALYTGLIMRERGWHRVVI
ncbi:MAG: YdcF family protein, partial [Caulobacteraceae bacterium]